MKRSKRTHIVTLRQCHSFSYRYKWKNVPEHNLQNLSIDLSFAHAFSFYFSVPAENVKNKTKRKMTEINRN